MARLSSYYEAQTCVNGSLERIPLKLLSPDSQNVLVVGIIIAKQRPRKIADNTKDINGTRAVWNCTIRDSVRDYINITYWGEVEEIFTTDEKCCYGDVVEIRNPRISIRKFNDVGEEYRPAVTSPYFLTLNKYSEIVPYDGNDIFHFKQLMNIPTKPLMGFTPLRDVHSKGANLKGRTVDILGAIRNVGLVRTITTKQGEEMQLREVIIFDQTNPGTKISLWEMDLITRASNWKPRSTILFITDARIEYSEFSKAYTIAITSRSVITENPSGDQVKTLTEYAEAAPLDSSAISDQIITAHPDPSSIQNVLSVEQVYSRICNHQSDGEPQFTALMFVLVTKLDLDGPYPTVTTRCTHCREWVKNMQTACTNRDCPLSSEGRKQEYTIVYNIKLSLSDHTGTLANCRLPPSVAEQEFGYSVLEFVKMTDKQKAELKWRYLLERFAVRVMVLFLPNTRPTISIINISPTNSLEVVERIPTA